MNREGMPILIFCCAVLALALMVGCVSRAKYSRMENAAWALAMENQILKMQVTTLKLRPQNIDEFYSKIGKMLEGLLSDVEKDAADAVKEWDSRKKRSERYK